MVRAQICDVALKLFGEGGLSNVTVRAIAKELGWSHTKAYHYYDSKQAIIDALQLRLFQEFGARLSGALEPKQNPRDQIFALAHAYALFGLENRQAYQLMFHESIANDAPDYLNAKRDASWSPILDVMTAAVESQYLSGDPHQLGHMFWIGLHGVVSLHLSDRLDMGLSLSDLIDPLVDQLLRGAAAQAS